MSRFTSTDYYLMSDSVYAESTLAKVLEVLHVDSLRGLPTPYLYYLVGRMVSKDVVSAILYELDYRSEIHSE